MDDNDLLLRIPCVTWRDRLVDVGSPKSEEEARIRVMTNAYWCSGLRAGVPEERDLFRYMLGEGPEEGDFDLDNGYARIEKKGKVIYRGVSTCGLVAGRIWEISGAKVSWADQPYRYGTAVSRIFAWGKRLDLYTDIPRPGDICLIGQGMAEHVLIYLARNEYLAFTVEGGQIDPEHRDSHGVPMQCISSEQRLYVTQPYVRIGNRALIRTVSVGKAFDKGLFGEGKVAVK